MSSLILTLLVLLSYKTVAHCDVLRDSHHNVKDAAVLVQTANLDGHIDLSSLEVLSEPFGRRRNVTKTKADGTSGSEQITIVTPTVPLGDFSMTETVEVVTASYDKVTTKKFFEDDAEYQTSASDLVEQNVSQEEIEDLDSFLEVDDRLLHKNAVRDDRSDSIEDVSAIMNDGGEESAPFGGELHNDEEGEKIEAATTDAGITDILPNEEILEQETTAVTTENGRELLGTNTAEPIDEGIGNILTTEEKASDTDGLTTGYPFRVANHMIQEEEEVEIVTTYEAPTTEQIDTTTFITEDHRNKQITKILEQESAVITTENARVIFVPGTLETNTVKQIVESIGDITTEEEATEIVTTEILHQTVTTRRLDTITPEEISNITTEITPEEEIKVVTTESSSEIFETKQPIANPFISQNQVVKQIASTLTTEVTLNSGNNIPRELANIQPTQTTTEESSSLMSTFSSIYNWLMSESKTEPPTRPTAQNVPIKTDSPILEILKSTQSPSSIAETAGEVLPETTESMNLEQESPAQTEESFITNAHSLITIPEVETTFNVEDFVTSENNSENVPIKTDSPIQEIIIKRTQSPSSIAETTDEVLLETTESINLIQESPAQTEESHPFITNAHSLITIPEIETTTFKLEDFVTSANLADLKTDSSTELFEKTIEQLPSTTEIITTENLLETTTVSATEEIHFTYSATTQASEDETSVTTEGKEDTTRSEIEAISTADSNTSRIFTVDGIITTENVSTTDTNTESIRNHHLETTEIISIPTASNDVNDSETEEPVTSTDSHLMYSNDTEIPTVSSNTVSTNNMEITDNLQVSSESEPTPSVNVSSTSEFPPNETLNEVEPEIIVEKTSSTTENRFFVENPFADYIIEDENEINAANEEQLKNNFNLTLEEVEKDILEMIRQYQLKPNQSVPDANTDPNELATEVSTKVINVTEETKQLDIIEVIEVDKITDVTERQANNSSVTSVPSGEQETTQMEAEYAMPEIVARIKGKDIKFSIKIIGLFFNFFVPPDAHLTYHRPTVNITWKSSSPSLNNSLQFQVGHLEEFMVLQIVRGDQMSVHKSVMTSFSLEEDDWERVVLLDSDIWVKFSNVDLLDELRREAMSDTLPSTSRSSTTLTAEILGGVIGFGVLLAILGYYAVQRYKTRRRVFKPNIPV